ncbi:MAG: polyprenyl synthetase family protein [Dehalococcoidia bacterium]|nr:polyprenyl synthetase family protein [Dehalococcoidia bacterium]
MQNFAVYGPIDQDLIKVEDIIRESRDVQFPWLSELLGHVLDKSGKRIRPAITLLAGRFYNYDLDRLVHMAASVELLHTATLVHDDTIDKAFVRRGTPTVNSLWDGSTAVLVGDYLFANSAEMVSRTANVRVMREFALTLMSICLGEMSQDFQAFSRRQNREHYLQRIGKKTASLFSMAAETGAVLSGAPEGVISSLKSYGYNLGMAFQITDDILDFTGQSDEMGKPVGSDLLQGTLTMPSIIYIEKCPDANPVLEFLKESRNTGSLEKALEEIVSSGSIEDAYKVANDFSMAALQALEILPQGPERGVLQQLAESNLIRRS